MSLKLNQNASASSVDRRRIARLNPTPHSAPRTARLGPAKSELALNPLCSGLRARMACAAALTFRGRLGVDLPDTLAAIGLNYRSCPPGNLQQKLRKKDRAGFRNDLPATVSFPERERGLLLRGAESRELWPCESGRKRQEMSLWVCHLLWP